MDGIINELVFEDDDYQFYIQLFMLVLGFAAFFSPPRNPSVFQQRCCWDECTDLHSKRRTLKRRLRMSHESFDRLLALICEDLVVNELMAGPRGGAIIPELCLFCTLRWLAGASYLDICDIAGISTSSFYRVVWKTVTDTCRCEALDIVFPQTNKQLERAMVGFASISDNCAIKNCVGVVDGYLLRIKVPKKKEVGNVKNYFSGHYQCYGVNMQAVADHHSRFIYFSVAAPGKTGDRDALQMCSLHELLVKLPFGLCVIGDPAYEASEHMVTMCSHGDRMVPDYDNFNFYASQCRIRIEMAFGVMQQKWGILQRPIGCSQSNLKWLAQAIARLHNCVVNERLKSKGEAEFAVADDSAVSLTEGTGTGIAYVACVPHDANGDPIEIPDVYGSSLFRGYSEVRERMVRRVKRLQLTRPSANRIVKTND